MKLQENNIEAFELLDQYCTLQKAESEESYLSEDIAIDLIFMMFDADWEALEVALHTRDDQWKIECLNILTHGPQKGVFLLKQMLYYNNNEIAIAAAYGLCVLIAEALDLEKEGLQMEKELKIDGGTLKRLEQIVMWEGPQYMKTRINSILLLSDAIKFN